MGGELKEAIKRRNKQIASNVKRLQVTLQLLNQFPLQSGSEIKLEEKEKENQTSAKQHALTTIPLKPLLLLPIHKKLPIQSSNIMPSTEALISNEQALN